MRREHLHLEEGLLTIRERIHLSPDIVHGLRDLQRGSGLGALEEEVFEEVRNPMLLGRFISRSCAHPNPDRDRADMRDAFGEHADTIRQYRLGNGLARLRRPYVSRHGVYSVTCPKMNPCGESRVEPLAGPPERTGLVQKKRLYPASDVVHRAQARARTLRPRQADADGCDPDRGRIRRLMALDSGRLDPAGPPAPRGSQLPLPRACRLLAG